MNKIHPICPYCERTAALITGAAIWPHLPHLAAKNYWRCDPCDAHVGCHPVSRRHKQDGTQPLGRLANSQLRRAKQRAHTAFDPLWKSKRMTRSEAYRWLASALDMSPANCHIGMFNVDQCAAVVSAVNQREHLPA